MNQITHTELEQILEQHDLWLSTFGRVGARADLQGANLVGVNLTGADLQYANLQGADLQDANLRDANLQCANLRDVNLLNANLQGVDFHHADLTGANLPLQNPGLLVVQRHQAHL